MATEGMSDLERRLGRPIAAPVAAIPAVFERNPMRWRDLASQAIPEREWRIKHWLTPGATLFPGLGGIGKTLVAQTIATALVLGRRYLDDIPKPLKVLFWACEDDHDELWRRQLDICNYFGCTFEDIADNLIMEPRIGLENTLFYAEYGAPKWTRLYGELQAQVNDYGADVTFLDNIGQTFGGKENERHHVTAFMNGMAGLGAGRPHSLIALAHPAKQSGSEYSGSTAWENSVRMRWYMGMKLPDQPLDESEEGPEDDPNVRYISKRKTNYTIKDYRKLTYRNGVFVPDGDIARPVAQRYTFGNANEAADDVVLKAIDRFALNQIRTTEGKTSPDYLPRKIIDMKLAQGHSKRDLIDAMNRLRIAGRIAEGVIGKYPNRTPKTGLIRVIQSAQT